MDREVVYKEIKHLTMLRDVKHVVYIYAVYELENVVHIVMEVWVHLWLHGFVKDYFTLFMFMQTCWCAAVQGWGTS
jgi:hypothetical protein